MKPRRLLWFERVVLLAWTLGTALLAWVLLAVPHRVASPTRRDFVVDIPEGASLEQIGALLQREGIVEQPRAWAAFMRIISDQGDLRRHTWVVNRGLSAYDLLPRMLMNRGPAIVNVPIPEGFNHLDVAKRLSRYGIAEQTALLAAMRDPSLLSDLRLPGPTLEGYLFPSTYPLTQDSNPQAVLRRIVSKFRNATDALFRAYEAEKDGAPVSFTPHQLLTLASIVEREAHVAEERPIIAGVFMNRLVDPTFRPHRLQADPTVAYGCLVAPEAAATCRDFDGRRITPAMVRDSDNPYNTYRIEGLPPGPICNPGLSAIEAALKPQAHGFFYFVAKGQGRHAFSSTLAEHNARVHGGP